jgi:hypothetical protein
MHQLRKLYQAKSSSQYQSPRQHQARGSPRVVLLGWERAVERRRGIKLLAPRQRYKRRSKLLMLNRQWIWTTGVSILIGRRTVPTDSLLRTRTTL